MYLAEVFLLVDHDDESDRLMKCLERNVEGIPIWIWITHVPTLVKSLRKYESGLVKTLHRTAQYHPQAVFYYLRLVFVVVRRIIMRIIRPLFQENLPIFSTKIILSLIFFNFCERCSLTSQVNSLKFTGVQRDPQQLHYQRKKPPKAPSLSPSSVPNGLPVPFIWKTYYELCANNSRLSFTIWKKSRAIYASNSVLLPEKYCSS